jgi:hypothetical protein
MNNAECKPNMQDVQEGCKGAYSKKKKNSVAGQFEAVKYMSETYSWTQKLSREDYGVDKYCGYIFFFKPAEI